MWCVHVIDAHSYVCLDYRFTHSAVSIWITHIYYCLQLDHRYTLLCPAGLQIHTIVSGFIRAWGSKLNFSCLWTKCFTHGTSPFLIHRVITHRTICLCHFMKEDRRGQLEISKWSALPNFQTQLPKARMKHPHQERQWQQWERKGHHPFSTMVSTFSRAETSLCLCLTISSKSTGCAKLPRDMAFPSFLSATLPGAPPSVLLLESTFN